MTLEGFREVPERKETAEEREKRFEELRGPFLAAVKAELEKMKAAGKMTPEEALQKFAEAGKVDVALTEKDARIFAWTGVGTQEEIQKIQDEK